VIWNIGGVEADTTVGKYAVGCRLNKEIIPSMLIAAGTVTRAGTRIVLAVVAPSA
jgi:hypothetical protein